MSKLVLCLTIGLPASGKTTFAKQLVLDNPKYKRINRDSLRDMIDIGEWSKSKEKHIREVEVRTAEYFFSVGFNVIIDDCNLAPSTQKMWEECAKKNGAVIVYKDFTNVSLEECLKRDKKRQNYVGEKVIRDMYRDFLAKPISAPVHDPALAYAMICDLDGTLALFGKNNPYDRNFLEDELNGVVADLVRKEMNEGTVILFTSGRNDKFRDQTEEWLRNNGLYTSRDYLFMREDGDFRQDVIVKKEMYEENIKGIFNVKYCCDDRDQCINLWRSLGLIALQVAEGGF